MKRKIHLVLNQTRAGHCTVDEGVEMIEAFVNAKMKESSGLIGKTEQLAYNILMALLSRGNPGTVTVADSLMVKKAWEMAKRFVEIGEKNEEKIS